MPSLEKYVQKIHKKLNNEGLEEQKIKKYLQELDRIQITLDVLKVTGIGRAVNRYRKHSNGIGDIASHLVTKWKELLKKEPSHCSQSSSSRSDDKGIFHLNSKYPNHTRSDSHSTFSASQVEMDRVSSKHAVKSKHKTGEIKTKVHVNSSCSKNEQNDDTSTPLMNEVEMDHVNNKSVKSKHKTGEIKTKVHLNSNHGNNKQNDGTTATTTSSVSEVERDLNNKPVKSKHKSGEIKMKVQLNSNHDNNKQNEIATATIMPSASEVERELNSKPVKSKHKSGEIKTKVHLNSNHSNNEWYDSATDTSTPSVSEVERDFNNQLVKSKHKSGEIKTKAARPAPQLCDVSFGCEPINIKQKKRPTSTASAAMAIKMTASDSVRPEHELPPLPSSLSVNKSLLPEIQPTYKPMRVLEYGDLSPKKKKGIVGSELDEHALMSRKSRTQVFSGRKLAVAEGVVTSLFELAIKVLIENIDALGDTGGVPYDILHPVLEKCNPQQLLNLEECNPYFVDDTEPLWEKHCCREFKGTKPKHGQTWRELYMKNGQEREDRLKKINEKITASQKAKKPKRQVQLAYVTTEAKPPREVRRKQAKFGTGTAVHPGVPVTAPSRSACMPQVQHRNVVSSPAKRPAVPAPMMKKTMKLFKNQRSRATTSIKRT